MNGVQQVDQPFDKLRANGLGVSDQHFETHPCTFCEETDQSKTLVALLASLVDNP